MDTTLLLAIATFVLAVFAAASAVATCFLAWHNRRLVEQNRQLVEQNRILALRPWATALIGELETLATAARRLEREYRDLIFTWYRRTDRQMEELEVRSKQLSCTGEFRDTFPDLAGALDKYNEKAEEVRSELDAIADAITWAIPAEDWDRVWAGYLERNDKARFEKDEAYTNCVGLMMNRVVMGEAGFQNMPMSEFDNKIRVVKELWPQFGEELAEPILPSVKINERVRRVKGAAGDLASVLQELESSLREQEHEYRMEYKVHPRTAV